MEQQQCPALLDVVIVTRDFPDHGVHAGERGTIVEVYTEPDEAYKVEFVQADGRTRALFALRPDQFQVVWRAEELRRAEYPPRLYHILIEPSDGAYRAYARSWFTATPSRQRVQDYLAERLAAGAPQPVERAHIETVVIHNRGTPRRAHPPDAPA